MQAHPSIPFLLDLLRLAMRKEAAAVYVVPWMPPTLRIDERSVPLSSVAFTPEQSTLLVLDVLDDTQRAALDRSREIQFSFVLDGVGRFRVHAFRRHGQPAMAIRPFALQVPTPRTLALPALACTAVMADRGLLLLTSRSSTLRRDVAAALMEHRNRNGQGELALLDDASRFWHERARCVVRQGLNATAVDDLLQRRTARLPAAAPPPGPLAIAWGELRDSAQLERVVRAAERALCIITLDTGDVLAALQRLITLAGDSGDLRHRMAIALHGVLALRPVPAAAGGNDLAATDALMNSPELAATLAEGELPLLPAQRGPGPAIAGNGAKGSTGADEHLWQLMVQGLVAPHEALRHAVDRNAFSRRAPTEARSDPAAATAPVTVDTGFADLFDPAAASADPFDFAEGPPPPRSADTQFDSVDWADDPTPSRPAALRTLQPGTPAAPSPPEPLATAAQFHAWAPPAVMPGQTVAIDLWAALPAQADELAARARQALELAAPAPVPDDGTPVVTLQLRIDGLLPAAPAQRLAWQARPARVRFMVPVPAQARPGAHAARVKIVVAGLPIGELSFVLNVVPDTTTGTSRAAPPSAPPEDTHAARRMLQSAYAAYAHTDRDQVLASVQALQVVAPGLDVFVDAPLLRSSDQWRERIEREAGRRERLFLFWSSAAAESPWVDFEWRLMMRRRGPGVIDALLLEPPRLAPLPPELADMASAELRLAGPGQRV